MGPDLPLVIGTAGHVDHGKTTLIRALTGVDTDRLAEEKRRGMTIELGFAPFRLPSGRLAGVVDVPGHERFLKTMLAGASGIDVVLLVVAADDGVMPQTREHLAILAQLAVPRGLVVVTKTDAVEPDLLELAFADVREGLAGTFLQGAPLLGVSAVTGEGLPALLSALEATLEDAPARDALSPARLPIDRVFVKPGFGTIVTGTLMRGTLREGDHVELAPAGLTSRIRGLQVHGESREGARAGMRVALNLAGLEHDALGRGDWLIAPGALAPSTLLDVELAVLPDAPPLKHRTRVRVHHGSAERLGRVALLDRDVLAPGERGLAQIVLEGPLVADHGDRFVLRAFSPAVLLGGGRVLHPTPPKRRRRHDGALEALGHLAAGDDLEALEAALRHAGRQPQPEAALLALVPAARRAEARAWLEREAFALEGRRYWHAAIAESLGAEVEKALAPFHRQQAWRLGLKPEELAARTKIPLPSLQRLLAALSARGRLKVVGRCHALPGHAPRYDDELARLRDRLLALLEAQPLADAADLAALGPDPRAAGLVEDLVEASALSHLGGGLYVATHRLGPLCAQLRERCGDPSGFSASAAREALGTTRKYLIPFLEYLDGRGLTRRQGDVRFWRDR